MGETTREFTGTPSAITATLCRLLYEEDRWDGGFGSELIQMEAEHGDEVYSELLFLLTHLRFDPPVARNHWARVLERKEEIEKTRTDPVDIRVALVDYFIHVNRKLQTPKVIELRLFQKAVASAFRDGLTGLYNYRYFREHLRRELERIDRYDACLTLLMIDVDDFKTYNDLNGHEAGNEALATIAKLATKAVRSVDLVCRYGGEEFAVILPSTTKDSAVIAAERIRQSVEGHPFPGREWQPLGRLTVSTGLATYPADGTDADDLVRNTDTALYVAKSRGKNIVHIYGEDRRSYHRVDVNLKGHFRALTDRTFALTTENISAGGMLFTTVEPVALHSVVEVVLELDAEEEPFTCAGRVVWVNEMPEGYYEVGVKTVEVPREHRPQLLNYIRSRQT